MRRMMKMGKRCYHAKQNYQLGDQKYKAQSRLEKEEYVYDELMKNHKEQLTDYQISGARKYLDEVREEHMKEIAKKLTNDNTTLRKWVGGITKDHLVPMQKQIYDLSQNLDLGKDKKITEKVENPKIDMTPKSYLIQPKTESAKEKELAEKLEKSNQESMELYRRYEEQKSTLFKIFENSKIEQIGMTGTKNRVVVELSEQEWKELKEVI